MNKLIRDLVAVSALVVGLVLGGMVSWSYAEELTSTFQWTEYSDTVDGFILYRDTLLAPVGDIIPVSATTVSATYKNDGKCHNYWLRAVKGTMFSGNSAIAQPCPPGVDPPPAEQPPATIQGFTVTTTTVVMPTQ